MPLNNKLLDTTYLTRLTHAAVKIHVLGDVSFLLHQRVPVPTSGPELSVVRMFLAAISRLLVDVDKRNINDQLICLFQIKVEIGVFAANRPDCLVPRNFL